MSLNPAPTPAWLNQVQQVNSPAAAPVNGDVVNDPEVVGEALSRLADALEEPSACRCPNCDGSGGCAGRR